MDHEWKKMNILSILIKKLKIVFKWYIKYFEINNNWTIYKNKLLLFNYWISQYY